MSALRCPQCRAVYAEPARFCTRDGTALEPKEEASDLPGTVLDERFEVRRQIGEGGMAAVFLASDLAGAISGQAMSVDGHTESLSNIMD